MQSKIYLYENLWTEKETLVYSSNGLSASIFTYSTGVKAIKIANEKGYATVLPYMGQMVWNAVFNGVDLRMKSIYDEPVQCKQVYGESYGCFLMHCGLTAMGNPTAEDTHLPHGELPIAKYNTVYLIAGADEKGEYIGVSGTYSHKACFELNYDFTPVFKLYAGATYFDVTATFTNKKDIPLEYYYLCHINHRPVDGAKLCYTADRKQIKINHEVPENYWSPEHAKKTNAYLDMLDDNPYLMDTIGGENQSYHPEIVMCAKYQADENGNAYTMQVNPDGTATYVIHRPEELPYGTRWISRTDDEDALGMVLPATSEHLGKLYCQRNNQQLYLKKGDTITYTMQTGVLTKEEADKMQAKIKSMGF
ncbi:MAG: DUF4432 family protein [Clostridia bacterium]|nr:DUF4432 family protein [Clostridia bacterium]